jgi:hypothetical protein
MSKNVVALAGVFVFSLVPIVGVHAQETFDVQWQVEPIDRISRTTGSSVDVKFKSGATMTVKRTPPEAVAVQLDQCVFTLEVFFASFPKSGKEEAG